MNSPEGPAEAAVVVVGSWTAHRASGELIGPAGTQVLEPKVMELLFLLAMRRGQVVSREEISARLWPKVVVNEDFLARCVFKLRKALGDDARAPRYIETLSRRGYRLAPEPTVTEEAAPAPQPLPEPKPKPRHAWWFAAMAGAALLAGTFGVVALRDAPPSDSVLLLQRADDFYHQMTQAQNEAALELYRRLIERNEQLAGAYAGLANVHAQRAIRWPRGADTRVPYTNLTDAIRGGEMRNGYATRQLVEAQRFAERAITLAPGDARAHKALGLVLSARENFAAALASHQRAIELDPDSWAPLIDAGDVLELSGRPREALPYFEAAYAVMTRQREQHSTRIMPWYARTAVLIGDRYEKLGEPAQATHWYRRALDYAPLHAEATGRLAALLEKSGDRQEAQMLCAKLRRRVSADGCVPEKKDGLAPP